MTQSGDLPKILYIAGYGRSGSTILDVLLGAHDRVVSLGEMTFLGTEWKHEDRICACGAPYTECPFWSDALESVREGEALTETVRAVEHRRALPRLLTGTVPEHYRHSYRRRMRELFTYAARRGKADVVVDSSKSARKMAGRFWALRNVADMDVCVVHLVRDGRDVLNSVAKKGSNWAMEGYRKEKPFRVERALAGWVLANSIACVLGNALDGERYLRVHFEDLLDTPEQVLHRIGSFAGVDMASVVKRVRNDESFDVGHNIGGNRIRFNESIKVRNGKNHKGKLQYVSFYHSILFNIFGKWINSKLR